MTALHIDTTKRRLYLDMDGNVLLTTVIKFLKGCHKIDLKVEVKNPVEFVMEVFGYDESNNENSKDQIRRLGTMLLKNIL